MSSYSWICPYPIDSYFQIYPTAKISRSSKIQTIDCQHQACYLTRSMLFSWHWSCWLICILPWLDTRYEINCNTELAERSKGIQRIHFGPPKTVLKILLYPEEYCHFKDLRKRNGEKYKEKEKIEYWRNNFRKWWVKLCRQFISYLNPSVLNSNHNFLDCNKSWTRFSFRGVLTPSQIPNFDCFIIIVFINFLTMREN